MAEKKKMSVAEILAAARKQDGGKGGAEAASEPAPAEPAAPPQPAASAPPVAPAAEAPATKPAAKPAGARPSVAEMMAMARAEKGVGSPAAPAAPAAKAPGEKPAPKAQPTAKAEATVKAEAEKPKPPPESASILAAARKEAKPGPLSKAEAAKLKPDAPAKEKPRAYVPPMPAKPDYAKPKAKAEAVEERRGFLSYLVGTPLAIGFTSMTASFGLMTLGLARFMFPNILTEPPSRFPVGFPSDFPPGSVEEKFKALFGVWIVNAEYQGKPQIFALRTVCTHLGCTPNWLEGEQKFKCPCHGSGFYKDGINFEGPAPRPLERYSIQLADDGQLVVDKSKLFQEELGQWADPSSFVSV